MITNKLTDKIKELEYPYNLIYAIFDDDTAEADEMYNNVINISDFKGTIEYVLFTLSDRERAVTKYRFEELKTFDDIAKILGVCRERARQINNKALRKLRHPSRANYIRYGINGFIENLKSNYERALDIINEDLATAKTELSNIKKELEQVKEIPAIYLEDMDFSVRTYNCLKRARINTLADCLTLTYDDLTKIRNLGRRSAEEVIAKLHYYGYEMR